MELKQGDLRLLETDLARRLLGSTELARVAYVAKDGTPRVFPVMFHWTGDELVFGTFAGSAKIAALRTRPAVALTIDTAGPPPEVLLLRGQATVTDVDGILPEYAAAHHHYYGPEQGARNIADVAQSGRKMVRVGLVPDWVGTLDFVSRFPAALS
ncbi:UDP-N-acetyl-D-mannosaminuronic acid transferase (WecB/TagA/CpsF family) [Hamadaea flava]|uniref:Pyridoxamine 5'-phosphate oxidase family protein n=1 Tax=Hamadaea flava TaxID=1742688 RepID=A0ABV8LQB4_9ACTN|nr:pyridoxamine 5'-phosphate oxidase family protein [Hamadaea flava]MCP2322970.1 UDP-N-acetyl-D-mannosaminuronic acid transferase (WecB/TagA/CpsF family) [Hamadaea flava]